MSNNVTDEHYKLADSFDVELTEYRTGTQLGLPKKVWPISPSGLILSVELEFDRNEAPAAISTFIRLVGIPPPTPPITISLTKFISPVIK